MTRRFELNEPYRNIWLGPKGTTVVRPAKAWGYDAFFETPSPCCGRFSRICAVTWAGIGSDVTCRGCGWKWHVYLAGPDGKRLESLPRNAGHPHIRADRAEWVSSGWGARKL